MFEKKMAIDKIIHRDVSTTIINRRRNGRKGSEPKVEVVGGARIFSDEKQWILALNEIEAAPGENGKFKPC